MKYILLFFVIITFFSFTNQDKKGSDKNLHEKKEIISDIHSESLTFRSDTMKGERIDGPANIRNKENGKILFELNDWTLVETAPIERKWQEIGLFVKLTEKQAKEFRILPNIKLETTHGKFIGVTKDTVQIMMGDDTEGLIMGYTFEQNIKSVSVPEKALVKILKEESALTKSKLEPFMKDFGFEEYDLGLIPEIKQYFIYQSFIVDPSPRDRITLLFENSILIGIVHSRELNVEKYNTYKLIRGHKLTITTDMSQNKIEELKSKRIRFYNSVD